MIRTRTGTEREKDNTSTPVWSTAAQPASTQSSNGAVHRSTCSTPFLITYDVLSTERRKSAMIAARTAQTAEITTNRPSDPSVPPLCLDMCACTQ